MQLLFTIKNQTLKLITRSDVVADSAGYLGAKFVFTDDWTVSRKIAQFKRDKHFYNMLLDSNNECIVPWEVLVGEGVFNVNVIGEDDNNTRVTVNSVDVTVGKSGLTNGQLPDEPSMDLPLSILGQLKQSETNAKNSATAAAKSASDAAKSQTAAKTSESNAKTSETAAKTSEENARTSETNAAQSATSADNSKKAAALSERNSKTSETNALASQTAAKTSEDNAAQMAKNAKTSEVNASNSAKSAENSEVNAANSAETATTQATSAAQSANDANVSKVAAEKAKTACENTKAGWDDILYSISCFNSLGLYSDSAGYICQKE